MNINLRNIVWTAVVATATSITAVVLALVGTDTNTVLALVGMSITAGLLAQREK